MAENISKSFELFCWVDTFRPPCLFPLTRILIFFTEPMTEAPHWYTEFNQMKVQKIVFEADK